MTPRFICNPLLERSCVVGPDVLIGAGTRVGRDGASNSVIRNSVIGRGCVIGKRTSRGKDLEAGDWRLGALKIKICLLLPPLLSLWGLLIVLYICDTH